LFFAEFCFATEMSIGLDLDWTGSSQSQILLHLYWIRLVNPLKIEKPDWIWTKLMEKKCDVLVVKRLHFSNGFDFIWTWSLHLKKQSAHHCFADCFFFKFYGKFSNFSLLFEFTAKGILGVFLCKFAYFGLVFSDWSSAFLFNFLADFCFVEFSCQRMLDLFFG